MFTYKQIVTSIAVIAACVIPTTLSQANFSGNGDWSCKGPNGEDGYCIPHKFCKPVTDLLSQLRSSQQLTQDVAKYLQKFICGYFEDQARLCCPFAPIILPNQRIDSTAVDISNHQNINLLPQTCGTISDKIRIYGGNAASLYEFPWMALLSYDLGAGAIGFRCGGTIINDRYILTAAQCITGFTDIKLIGVRVGEHDIRTLTDCEAIERGNKTCASLQNIAINEMIPHSEYGGKSFAHDIGLIRLASPIDLSQENAKPICLPTEKSLRNINLSLHKLTVTGWGLSFTGEQSPTLLKANISVTPEEACRKAYEKSKSHEITSNHICAGSKTSDACLGDSGGPLQRVDVFQSESRYIQYGIESFGPKLCNNTALPGVYTKVDSYLKWILDNLRP